MDAVIFIGIQASGKTAFYRERFFESHIRLSLDMLRTRRRLDVLLRACIDARQPFVLDNTNVTAAERAPFISLARTVGFSVRGYYFQSDVSDCLRRNKQRDGRAHVPIAGILGTAKKLELPRYDEGFDHLFVVQIPEPWTFAVRGMERNA